MPVKRGKDGRWRYREVVQLPDGRRQRISGSAPRHCNTKVAAQQALIEHVLRLKNPERYQSATKKEVPTLEVFAQEFLRNYVEVHNKPSMLKSTQSALRVHLLPTFGEMCLDKIRPRNIEAFKADKLHGTKRLSWKSINNHLSILRRMLAVAKKWELIDTIPEVQWLKGPKPSFDFLDFDEAERLLAAAEGQWQTMFFVALKTGLRRGELHALRWQDIDLQTGQLRVCQSVVDGIVGTPKSGKGRIVPLSDQTITRLRAHQHSSGLLVFCRADGTYLNPEQCRTHLNRACRKAGLRRFGIHVLRHTFASHLVMRGVALKVVQELLGHASMDMTLRYAHLAPHVKRDAVQTLDEPSSPNGKGKPKSGE